MVQIKKKVTIKVKRTSPEGAEAPINGVPPTGGSTHTTRSWFVKLLLFLIVLIVVVVIFVCFKNCKGQNDANTTEAQIEKTEAIDSGEEDNGNSTIAEPISLDSDEPQPREIEDPSTSTSPISRDVEEETQVDTPSSRQGSSESTLKPAVSSSIEETARRVIRGDFGNGEIRKTKLGKDYVAVQNKVNEMYRNGLVN